MLAVALGATAIPAASTAAVAATSPFQLTPPSVTIPETTTTAVSPTTTTAAGGSGSFTGTDAITIAAVAMVLLIGIAVYVTHDSRKHARSARGWRASDGPRAGSKAPPKQRRLSAAERRRRKRGRAR